MGMELSAADTQTYRVCTVQPPLDATLTHSLEHRYAGTSRQTGCVALLCQELRPHNYRRKQIAAGAKSVQFLIPQSRFTDSDVQIRVSRSLSGHVWSLIEAPTPTLCLRHVLARHRFLQSVAALSAPGCLYRSGVAIPRTTSPTAALWQSQASLAMVEASAETGHLCFFGPQLACPQP